MAEFTIQDERNGRTLTVEGDRPPTPEEMAALFAQAEQQGLFRPAGDPEIGLLETVGTMLTGAAGEVVGGVAGIGAAASNLLRGEDMQQDLGRAVQAGREAITVLPQTQAGQQQLAALGELVRPVGEFIQGLEQSLGETAFEATGSPAAAAAATAAPTAAMEALGIAPLRGGARAAVQVADEAPRIDAGLEPPEIDVPEITASFEIVNDSISQARAQKPEQPTLDDFDSVEEALRTKRARDVAREVRPDAQILADAEALGVDLNPSHYSTNQAFIEVEQAIKARPENQLSAREIQAIKDVGDRADNLIEELGGTTDKSFLDADIRNRFTNEIESLDSQSERLYKRVEEAIPKRIKVKPLASRNYIQNKLAELGGDESLLSTAERQLLRVSEDANNPTYAALDRIRKNVGAGFSKNKGPFKDDEEGILRQVYRVLSEDQQGVANVFDVGPEYESAKKLVQARKQLEDNAKIIFGRDLTSSLVPKLRTAGTNLSKGDLSNFRKLIDAVPENRRSDVVASMLNDLFTGGARAARTGVGQGFVNVFDNLGRNKAAKNELFNILGPEARKRFDQIGRVARGIFNAKKAENTSNSGRAVLTNLEDGGFLKKAAEMGREVAKAEGVTTATGVPGAGTGFAVGSYLTRKKTPVVEATEELFFSDKFQQAVRQAASDPDKANDIITQSPEYQRWAGFVPEDTLTNIAAVGFLQWLGEENGQTR